MATEIQLVKNQEENSVDSGNEGEIIGMVDEESFPVATYQFVQVMDEGANNSMTTSPEREYFMISSNSDEVYNANSGQRKGIRRDTIQSKVMQTTKKRDDRRRATHNEVERRRRDKINSWITKLAALIPTNDLPDSASKGGILAKACDYISEVNDKFKRFTKLQNDRDMLIDEVLKLKQELSELRKENVMLRSQVSESKTNTEIQLKVKSET